MNSIIPIILSAWFACSNLAFAQNPYEVSAKEKHTSSYVETGAAVFGVCTNAVGFLSGVHSLSSFDRRATTVKHLNTLLNLLDLSVHCANLSGFGTKILEDLIASEEKFNSLLGSKGLLAFNGMSFFFHLSNFFLIERNGLAQLFHLHDAFEMLGHLNDIRANSDL